MKKILQKENSILRKVAQEVPIKEIGSAKIKKIIKEMTEAGGPPAGGEFLIFINPKILKTSQKKVFLKEGCLSLTGIYKEIWRKEKALIEAYDENGKKFRRGASGLLAEIIQHEIDHLNGILFIDKK